MMHPEKVIWWVRQGLKHHGRFVFEMGGEGNVAQVLFAIEQAAKELGVSQLNIINYYPKLGEYTSLLEAQGFSVIDAKLIDRPTLLEGEAGLCNWVRMFRHDVLNKISEDQQIKFFQQMETIARPNLYQDNQWWVDYVRLRAIAIKEGD